MPLKSGGDAGNFAEAGSLSGNADSAGVGAGVGVLGSLGLGLGESLAASGFAGTEQYQDAKGGDAVDNTKLGDININT